MNKKKSEDRSKSLNDDFSLQENSSRIIKGIPRPKDAVFIRRLDIKPSEQARVPLGSFTSDSDPKGFLVEVEPDPSPANSVVTEVTSLGSNARYSLHLHIANFSSKSVHVEVWRL